MEQILLAYDFSIKTITIIMILYKNMKAMVCPLDGDTDLFDIVTGILQGDTLAPYMFMLCLDYVLQTSIDMYHRTNVLCCKERSPQKKKYSNSKVREKI